MPAQWACDLVGQMHKAKITKSQLAEELGMTREYVSMVLNGHREPAGAKERFEGALERIVERRRTESPAVPTLSEKVIATNLTP